ncbi:MAG TPA: Na/Pi cotransporter family protein [Xanthomonadales bacterium]|nr:Na/Pi cotransporter family protein [Xanthomonadales bacterium]
MDNPFSSFDLWAGLLGGLALFLFGMDVMTQALKSAAGDYMKDILGKLTRNRFVGVGTGAFVTAIIQSSSVTTVILVGFISAGLMSMSQSVAVIMGANIGTTITAQILAFKVTKLALPIIAVGFGVAFTARRNEWRQVGMVVLGLGMVFYGMSVMSDGLSPLRSYEPFIGFMLNLHNPLLGAAVGMGFTALVQSSSATTGILIVMASQGLIALEPAIAIALGANVGTCITAGLAVLGKPREAVRAAVVHTLFNVAGVLIWIFFIPQLAQLAVWISPAAEGLSGLDHMAAETPRQIANVHTFFNLANTLLLVGFTTQIARLVEWLIPDRPVRPDEAMLPRYLDYSLLSTPAIALEAARLEIGRLGNRVSEMVSAIMPAAISGSRWDLQRIAEMDKAVDRLHIAIIEFLGKVSIAKLTSRQSNELMQLAEIANDLEHVGDRIATSMVTSAQKRIDEDVSVSAQTAEMLREYHAYVVAALNDALQAVTQEDPELAKEVSRRKKGFSALSRKFIEHGFGRLTADAPNRLRTYAREMEVMEILDGVFTIVRRIARSQQKLKKA